jgi:hypothetical protein
VGYAKVIKVSDRKVRLVHQLDNDGKPYAEDITIEVAESVNPSRLAYLTAQDGKIGVSSFGFRETDAPDNLTFPD